MNRSLRRNLLAALLAAISPSIHAAQESGVSRAAYDAGQPYVRALESAASAYASRNFSVALDKLDMADQIRPNVPDTWNMRGAIYAEQHAFEKAEDAFEKAARLNPGDFWPRYNLAQLLLMEKKFGPAAEAFQKLTVYQGHDELIQFKVVFSDILDGKPEAAKAVVDAMKFPCDTPAYYFAQAAYAFGNKDNKEGNYWTKTGLKVFGASPCISYYDALAGLGWLAKRGADGSIPEPAELTALPAATPGMDLLGHPAGTP